MNSPIFPLFLLPYAGKHTIVDIYCNDCGTNLGWRYQFAVQESQKYKEGKYILERVRPGLEF